MKNLKRISKIHLWIWECMNKEQFIYWFKGFTKAVNEEGPTPKQWETIVSELDKIKDCPDYGSPIDDNKLPIDPNKWKITCTKNTATYPIPNSSVSYTSNFEKENKQLELDLK